MLTKLKSLGPGLLYAGAAIGVSHLVQSTKAGATYGYVLIVAIVLAHIFKYPFFAIGPRYAKATGTSLVTGYAQMGKWAVILLLVLTISTMFTVQAAVTLVTAGILQHIGAAITAPVLSLLLLLVCFVLLNIGNYSLLDHLMKMIMIVLSLSTLTAFILSFNVDIETLPSAKAHFDITTKQDLGFLMAFVGWMPAPLDIAIWHSIWTLANGKPKEKGNFDFNVGFFGTAILGICFLVLGAHTLYGTGETLAASAGGFAAQLITTFTSSLGSWSYWLISIAAFTTMFSTTLTCFDAMPRVMGKIGEELNFSKIFTKTSTWQIVLLAGSAVILFYFISSMKQMVTFATIISFLTAPVLAWLSYKLVTKHPQIKLWSTTETRVAKMGIVALVALSILYVVSFL